MLKQYWYSRSTTATNRAEPPNILFRTFLYWVLQMRSIMGIVPQEASVVLKSGGRKTEYSTTKEKGVVHCEHKQINEEKDTQRSVPWMT
jgi:hypothetical protein